MHAKWFEDGPPSELLRVFAEVEGRLYDTVEMQNLVVLLDKANSDPPYIYTELDKGRRAKFVEHLAEAGLARSEWNDQVGVLSPEASWSRPEQAICVEAQIVDREDHLGFQVDQNGHGLREFLPRTSEVKEVIAKCAEYPCELIMNPTWGIHVVWVGLLNGEENQLNFEVEDSFVDSVVAMGYPQKPGVAASCLRAMALIAGGRSDEVEGHETKRKGPGSDTLRVGGHAVMRSRIENRRPDANRLHWIRGSRPKFLNVSGHEGGPAL